MKKYDYVLIGAGLYSGVIAYLAGQAGKSCLVLERRDHTGGNIYCEEIEGIHVHKYGAHIFHTSNKEVWQFVNSLAESTVIQTRRLPTTKAKFIICRSI